MFVPIPIILALVALGVVLVGLGFMEVRRAWSFARYMEGRARTLQLEAMAAEARARGVGGRGEYQGVVVIPAGHEAPPTMPGLGAIPHA